MLRKIRQFADEIGEYYGETEYIVVLFCYFFIVFFIYAAFHFE